MEFRKATQEDLDFVRTNPFEDSMKLYDGSAVPEDNTFTALFGDEIVGIGGVQVKWQGRGLLWLIMTETCRKKGLFGIAALGAIRDKMEDLISINNLHRAEAAIRVDFPEAKIMIESFGFRQECIMKQYFIDKSDAYLYVRTT